MKKNKLNMNAIEPFFQKIASLTRLQRVLICVATVVVVVGAFGFFLYKPKVDQMAALRSDITSEERKLERTRRSAQEYDRYREKMEEARAQFEVVSRELPGTEEIPSLLTSISHAGNAAGLRFLLFQPQSESEKDFYAEIPIRMELTGTYHEFGGFLDRLARLSRIVNVNNCSTQGQNDSLRINCTAVTYRFIGDQPSQN